jgi:hypothetical protein
MDGMPGPCYAGATYAGGSTPYALKHNPAIPFKSVYANTALCKAHVLPYTSFSSSSIPKVTFIAPGICNDQHGMDPSKATAYPNCVKDTSALIKRGDDWLKARVPAMLAAGATVFITYDESGPLYAAEVGPGIAAGGTDARAYTHYSVLAAIERAYGLTLLGGARSATQLPL